jgi:DNA mismatch endonuclease Vsr
MPSHKRLLVPTAPPPAAGNLAERLQRSRTMAAIPSERTSLEQRLASSLWAAGVRGWRRSIRIERTRPDFVFARPHIAIFVDGCFWHGCPQCCRRPATNIGYWKAKLDRNIERDGEQTQTLTAAGWKVLRFWGHEIDGDPGKCALHIRLALAERNEVAL